jgi:hypothetical protein
MKAKTTFQRPFGAPQFAQPGGTIEELALGAIFQ